AAFLNATPPTIRTAFNDSRPQNCERNTPRICWHTILTCGNSERYSKPLKQRGFLPRSGGHSSSYWYQQGQVPGPDRSGGRGRSGLSAETGTLGFHLLRATPRTGSRRRSDGFATSSPRTPAAIDKERRPPGLLAGLLVDASGERLTPSHVNSSPGD